MTVAIKFNIRVCGSQHYSLRQSADGLCSTTG